MLAIIGFGPLSLTCLIGMYVVVARPSWFYTVVVDLYRDANPIPMPGMVATRKHHSSALGVRLEVFMSLFVLLVLDIAPVPVTGSIGLCIVILRPLWFRTLVEKMYGGAP